MVCSGSATTCTRRSTPATPRDLPQRAQDIEQAKSLLKQAGYDNNLSIKLTTSTSVSNGAPAAATVFAQQAKAAGVTVQVEEVSGDVFWGDEYLKYPFAMDNWGTRGYLAQAGFGTVPGAVYNETHWSDTNPKYVSLVEEAFKTVDDAKRNELITQASHHRVRRGRLHRLRLRHAGRRPQPEGHGRRTRLLGPGFGCQQREVSPDQLRVTNPLVRPGR